MRKFLLSFLVLISCVTMGSQFVSASTNTQNVENYLVKSKEGWQYENQNWFYYKSNLKKTGWLNSGGSWYYLNKSGVMQTGWLNLNETWYYMYSNGVMATDDIIDEWQIDSNGVATPVVSGMSFSSYASSITSLGYTSDGGGYYSYKHSNGQLISSAVVTNSFVQIGMNGYSDGLYSAVQTSINWLIPSGAGRAMSMISSDSPGSFESDGRTFTLQILSGAPVITIRNK